MGTPMSWIILLLLSCALVRGYNAMGFDGWYQPVPHRPVDIITDVINDLGVRILQQYTSHGNVAFSPTGVGFVLAALYEGSAGRGRQQIADALGLPRDRDVTRIGFRDIHRRLRTYLNADGFLGGLTLNQENTRLRPEYEDVLRFYGFDLTVPEEANETTSAPETTMMTEQPVTEAPSVTMSPAPTVTMSTSTQQSSQGSEEPVTMSTAAEAPMGDTQNTGTTASGTQQPMQSTENTQTVAPTTQQPMQSTENAATIVPTTQQPMEGSETIMSTTPMVELLDTTLSTADMQSRLTQSASGTTIPMGINVTSSEDMSVSSDETLTTVNHVQPTTMSSTVQAANGEPATTSSSSTPTASATSGPATSMEGSTTVSITSDSNSGVTEPSSESTTTSTVVETTMMEESMTASSMISDSTQVNENSSTNGPPADENTVSTDSSSQNTDLPVTTMAAGSNLLNMNDSMNRIRKRSVRSPRGFFSSYPDEGIWMQDLGIWKPYSSSLSEASVRDSTEISFLVNGCDVSSVTASRYFAVLPFAYFPSLHAVALEFPLDDPRYNILLLMSTDRRDTYRLARDLGGKSLRLLRKQLQATWVRATIPSFMLRGFVTLTSFLQRLGILDVFEPRSADLSPMTPDLGVYARDVQQSIGVNIRNYMKPDRTHSRNGLFERADPVPFAVVHPFLYFIVDAETSVALISGRVNDPLNSRIL